MMTSKRKLMDIRQSLLQLTTNLVSCANGEMIVSGVQYRSPINSLTVQFTLVT